MTLRLCRGEAPSAEVADLVAWAPDALSIRAVSPSPPGARVELVVPGSEGEGPTAPFRLKVHRCRRLEDGTYQIDGRPLDLRRETRLSLDALASR